MIRRKLHKLYAVIGVGLVSYGSTALAAPITVNNASFEAPDLHSGGNTWSNEIGPDWALGGAAPAGDSFIEFITGFASNEVQHIGLQGGRFIVQDTGVPVEPHTTYTLRVGVGNRNPDFSPAGALAVVGLTNQVPAADDTAGAMAFLAASKSVDSGPPQATASFVDTVVSITTGAEVEGNVVIVLGDDVSAGRAHFDNVRLDAAPSYIVNKTAGSIVADGNLSDWAGANQIVNPDFTLTTEEALTPFGQRIKHEAFDGGVWDGLADHSATVMALYDDENIYLAFVVTDDYHSNPGASGWNGDAAQMMIANDARNAQVALYNYALGGIDGALDGVVNAEHEARPPGGPDTAAGFSRSGTTTTYEIRIPKAAAGLASLAEGTQFGFAVSINDGDQATPGQKGWSGVHPGALVRGKNPELTELFTLGGLPPVNPVTLLGTGTAALLGGDLTDPENDGDPEADTGYNAVFSASEEDGFGGGESAWNVFDNRVGGGNDKWCCGNDPFPAQPISIKATFGQQISLTHFTVTSANDTPGRDPVIWEMQGSTDGVNFVTIFRQEGSIWTARDQVARIDLPSPSAGYTTFRFITFETGLTTGARYQLAEIELFGNPVQSGTPLIACWAFDGDADDDVAGLTGNPSGGVTYTDDAVRGQALKGGYIGVPDAGLFNSTTAGDKLSVSLWQKTPAPTDATSFWFVAPSSSGSERGFQVHLPWSDGTIYMDTAGCCDGPTRINKNPTGFNGFAWNDGAFHHFTFVKDGADRRIYIDGELFHEGGSAAPLPTDINTLWIGSAQNGSSTFPGTMDDFAVWGGALTVAEIAQLAGGADPKTLGGRVDAGPDPDLDGLRDAWEIATIGNTNSDADDDNDGDGQTNKEEQRDGTNPIVADTDGDGLSDGDENARGINPSKSDTDGDGLSDSVEVAGGTWPGHGDTDGDGLGDGVDPDPLAKNVSALAGLCHQWWKVGNPGTKDAAFAVINGGSPSMGAFKGTDVGGSGTWWTGNGTNIGIQNYPAALGFSATHNEENYLAYLSGEINIPEAGVYKFKDGVDDYTYLAIDLNGNGINGEANDGTGQSEILIDDNAWTGVLGADNGGSPIAARTITPGWKAIEFIAAEGGGGDAGVLYWDYGTGGIGSGVGFPAVLTAAIDAANAPGLLIPDANLRCFPQPDQYAGLCHQWWDVNNPGTKDTVFSVINAGNPTMGAFKGTDAGGSGTWWTGNGTNLGIQNYPASLGFPAGHNEESYIAYLTGEINIPEAGVYKFKDGVDDYTYLAIDLNGNGINGEADDGTGQSEVLIDDNAWTGVLGADNGGSPIAARTITPGWKAIEFVAAEGGGGDAGVLYWDYGTGGIGTGVGFPAVLTAAIDPANAPGLLIPDANLRCVPIDTDGDGMLDVLERSWFGDLSQDMDDDSDGDRSINADEFALGTNPSIKDTDGDGLWDGEEWIEVGLGTLPSVRDTDGDGISDGTELRITGTNPNNADSDGDGLSDGFEVENSCLYFQNFNHLANGTTNLGDGSIITSAAPFTAAVSDKALQMTITGIDSQNVTYRLPNLGDIGGDFAVAFDYSLAGGGTRPADGFSFNFGAIGDAETTGTPEEGFGKGLAVEFDTWDGGPAGKEDLAGNGIGIDISVNGATKAFARAAVGADPINNEFFVFDGASHHVEIISEGKFASELPKPLALFKLDFGNTPNSPGPANGTADGWNGIDNLPMGTAVAVTDSNGNQSGVTITALDDGFNPNNTAAPGAGASFDGIEIPQNVNDDYLFKITDTPGTSARIRVDGLAAGVYNVTLFEGRTTDTGQSAILWAGATEPAAANSGSFANGGTTTTIVVGAGQPLYYKHLEDGSGGISGIVIRQVDVNLALDLVSYWPLDSSPEDVAGVHDGVAMGAAAHTYDAGKLGGGVDLNGVDQFIQVSGDENVFDFQGGTGFTISAWFRVDAFTKNWQALIAKGEGNRWRIHRRDADNPNVFAANGGNGDVPAYSGADYPIADGQYHHIAMVSVPGDRVEMWIDGDLVSTGPAPTIENGANPMAIGENPDALGRTWNGGIDDVGAWDRPLTAAEIGALWNGGSGASVGQLTANAIPSTEVLNTITVKVDGVVIHDSVVVDFDPSAADRIAFAARTGGAHETLFFDNVCVVSGAELPASPSNPLIADPDAISRDPLLAASNVVFGGQLGADAFTFGVAATAANTNNWPAGEAPGFTIDGFGQKYLNFGKLNTGIVVIPAAPSVASGIQVWAANDAVERDPASYSVYGTNADLSAATGGVPASEFTLISTGGLALPASRNAGGAATALNDVNADTVLFGNTTKYAAYMIVFPTVKDEAAANSMQLAEVQLLGTMDPVAMGLLASVQDSDGDGNSDNAERVAGTNPNDAREFFHMSGISYGLGSDGNPTLVLGLATVPDQTYVLQFSPTMEPGTWENVDAVKAEETSSVFEIMNPQAFQRTSGFFRSILVEQN